MWSWNGDKAPAKPLVKAAKSSNLSALPHQTCSRSQLPFDYSWKLKSIHVHFFKAFDLMWRCKKTVHQQQIILRNTSSGGMTMESHFSNWQKICYNKNFWQMSQFGVEIKSLTLIGKRFWILFEKTRQFAIGLFCFDSCFHLTSIFLSCEIFDFCSEKSSNQIGIENQGVKSVNILNILYFSGAFSVI